jgi:hypothetical protein
VDCAYYQNEFRAAWKQWIAAVWTTTPRNVGAALNWFHSLKWQIQLAFILLAVLIFSPKWVPQIEALLKAFHGQ